VLGNTHSTSKNPLYSIGNILSKLSCTKQRSHAYGCAIPVETPVAVKEQVLRQEEISC